MAVAGRRARLGGDCEVHAEGVGVRQAELYIDLIAGGCQGLADALEMAAACDHIREGYRRGTVGRHAVYFRVRSHGIDIIQIPHERMHAVATWGTGQLQRRQITLSHGHTADKLNSPLLVAVIFAGRRRWSEAHIRN